ncbi:hypothetical protein D9758_011040 [Tetrapyrgos nigripes]|uniref:Uncharacterized protein n=1 Tax=Tetrapyrgos nigripes TaxID=182062 RepID=A0A8H5CSQ8_9AGAR|nr:hypothetical protein D9758_011040 [Tetrapyrgos nigripes]
MPGHCINQPFEVHVEDAHPQVKVGRRSRGRSVLMTTMEFRTATTSKMRFRAENTAGVRISVTGPKPGDDLDEEEGPIFEGTAFCRPIYNTRTAISVTHRDVNLALHEVPLLALIPENTVITSVYEECLTLDDIPPRPSCPVPAGDDDDDDDDDFPLKPREVPGSLVLTDLSTNLPPSTGTSSPSVSRASFDSYDSFAESSECSLASSQTSVTSQSSGRLNGLGKSVRRKLASSSSVTIAASVKGSKAKSVKGLLSSITKSKRRIAKEKEEAQAEAEAEVVDIKAVEVTGAFAVKGTKRSREDEENLPAASEQDSKEGRRIKRKLAAI